EEAGVTLEQEHVGSNFAYHGDEERLQQLVVNLGANALRFTPSGGRVVVRLIEAGSELELQVEDTGVGIPADALPHIFDAYRQAHRQRGGTGLGLAIVRGVADAHGGRVTGESQAGKGSRFTVLLPGARTVRRAAALDHLEGVGTHDGARVQRPTARVVVGHTPEAPDTVHVVVREFGHFADALPATMDGEASRLRQVGAHGDARPQRADADDCGTKVHKPLHRSLLWFRSPSVSCNCDRRPGTWRPLLLPP